MVLQLGFVFVGPVTVRTTEAAITVFGLVVESKVGSRKSGKVAGLAGIGTNVQVNPVDMAFQTVLVSKVARTPVTLLARASFLWGHSTGGGHGNGAKNGFTSLIVTWRNEN